MSEMVERVALLLAEGDEYAYMPEYRKRARRIIEAMRDPTDGMVGAAATPNADLGEVGEFEVESIWQTMIDEALK